MKQLLSVFLMLLLPACFVCAAEIVYPHYDLDLSIVPEKGTIDGIIKITLPWTEERNAAGTSIYFLLALNLDEARNPRIFGLYEDQGPSGFSPSRLRVPRVTVNGVEAPAAFVLPEKPVYLNYNQEHLVLKVDVPFAPETGTSVEIGLNCQVQLSNKKGMDDFYFDDMMVSRFSWLPVLEPPGFSLSRIPFSQNFFTFSGTFRLSSGWAMTAQGTEFNAEDENVFRAASGAPVSSIPLVLLKNYEWYETKTQGGKIVRAYYRKGNNGPARLVSSYSVDAVDYYSDTYFPLRNNYISIIQSTPGSYGMAADSTVLVGDMFFSGLNRGISAFFDPLCDYLLAHEIMHFYSGIGAGPDFLRDNYLSEGLTEFASISYIESKYGTWNNRVNRDSADILSHILHYVIRTQMSVSLRGDKILSTTNAHIDKWDYPLSGEPEDRILNSMTTTDYDTSFFVIKMLSSYLGREEFGSALKFYLEKNMGTIVDSEVLKSALEEFSGKNLDIFFNDYVYSKKWIDYTISGKLNERRGDVYFHRVTVSDKNNGEFIPSVITAFFADRTRTTIAAPSAGTYNFTTEKKVVYAGIDSDAESLDYDRSNNFCPHRMVSELTDEYWLAQGEATLYSVRPFYQHYSGSISTDYIGVGPYFYNRFFWDILMFPYVRIDTIPSDENASPVFRFGFGTEADLQLPGHNYFSFVALADAAGIVDQAFLSYTHNFYFDRDAGYVFHYYYPGLSLSLAAGVMNWIITDPADAYITAYAGLLLDNFYFSGTYAELGNDVLVRSVDYAYEDRISARIIQCFSPFSRILLGFSLSGSYHMGNMNYLTEGNYVKGFAADTDENTVYRAAGAAYIGFPLFNDIELPLLNWFVLQSINNVLFYDTATAFVLPEEWTGNFRHSAGIEQVFCFRTIMDIPFVIGYGLAFDLNAIVSQPDNPSVYQPVFFLDLDTVPLIYGSLAAY